MIINAENRDFLKTKFSTLGAPVPTLPPQLRWQRRLLCCGRQRNVWSWDVEESHRSCLASVPASSSSCARVPKIYRNNTSPYHAARWLFRSVILSPGPCTGGEGYSLPIPHPLPLPQPNLLDQRLRPSRIPARFTPPGMPYTGKQVRKDARTASVGKNGYGLHVLYTLPIWK